MTTFESIGISGFRRLRDVTLKLNPLNVIIGANGSGKTSLLDVFSLLAKSASGKLNETMSEMGGLNSNLSNLILPDGIPEAIRFDLSMNVSNHNPVQYQIVLKPQGVTHEILSESLFQQRDQSQPFKHIETRRTDVKYFNQSDKKLTNPNWDYNHNESALSQVPKMFQEPEEFRKQLASSTHYHVLDVSRRAPIRLPQQLQDAKLPGHDGEYLISCLYSLRETDPDRFELIEDTLRAGFPDFERLNFPPVAAGTVAMTWKTKTSNTPFYMHQLSEGTLRFLWLVSLLQSPGLTAVTMIDEPEVSLHPELLSLLAGLMREASQRTQLIVATHADRLVQFLKPEEVLAINVNEEGAGEIVRADELDLEKWLEEYTLDELWRMGRLGGRA